MGHAQRLALDAAHLAGAQLGHAVAVLREAGGLRGQHTLHAAILGLAASPDKDLASQLRRGAAGRNGVADVLDLRRHVVAARADRMRPRKVEERIGLFRDQLRQRGQLRRVTGHHMQPRVLRQQRRPRAARVGDRVDRHALRQQLCTQRHPDCPRRTGDDGGVDLSLNACHF